MRQGFFNPWKGLGNLVEKFGAIDEARFSFQVRGMSAHWDLKRAQHAYQMNHDDGIKLHMATMLPMVYTSQHDLERRRAVRAAAIT